MRFLKATILFLASAGMAHAGGSFDSAGTISGRTTSALHQIGEGHSVMELTNTQTSFDLADSNNPLAGMTGRCRGTLDIRGPSVSGGGMCFAQNDAGDMVVVNWRGDSFSAEGALNGSWVLVGGTGGLAGISGGGRYSSLTDRSTGDYVNTLTGAVTLP